MTYDSEVFKKKGQAQNLRKSDNDKTGKVNRDLAAHDAGLLDSVTLNTSTTQVSTLFKKLFNRMDNERIEHAFWKASRRLGNALEGEGDYDLLLHPEDRAKVLAILAETGFTELAPRPENDLDEMHHFVAADQGHNALLHLHLHLAPISGEYGVWEYSLGDSYRILRHREIDEDYGVYRLSAEMELVLLILRVFTEPKMRRTVGGLLTLRALKDLNYAWRRTRIETLFSLSKSFLSDELAEALVLLDRRGNSPADPEGIELLEPLIMQRLREFERTSTKEAKIRRAKRSIKGYSQAIYNKLRPNSWPAWSFQQGLRGLEDGAFIAIVGPDGAGKSTAAADLGKFLGTTLDTKSVYLGKGNLVSSAWQGLARVKWSILESTTNRKPPTREKIEIDREEIDINSELVQQVGPPSAFDADRTPLRQRAWELSRVAQALRQLRIVYLVRTDRMQGRFVISDRFPHHEERHAGGPGIVYNAGEDPWLTWVMAGAERAILGYIGTHYAPDLIIRLSVNAETAWRRKEDHNFHEIQRKVTAMERVNFPGAGSYLIVDASQPENTVKHEIRTQVWNHICQ